MPSNRVQIAKLEAELAAARVRRERLETDALPFAGPQHWLEVTAALAQVEADVLELEERRAELAGEAPPAMVDAPPAAPAPEYLDTKAAAALLGVSARTLEGLRARGAGPPHTRIGRRVLYAVADLRNSRPKAD